MALAGVSRYGWPPARRLRLGLSFAPWRSPRRSWSSSRSGGSRNKYELDPGLGGIVLDRRLFTSMTYPADYGYIEGTLGGDGDALDALVLVGDPTFPAAVSARGRSASST